MDQRTDRESRQEVLYFKCKKIIHIQKSTTQTPTPVQKKTPVGEHNPGSKISLQTPEKTNELSKREREAQVPEKYKLVAEFFDCISCSLRLLGLRKKLPTFQNICPQVEVLTSRKFSYRHLAQIKYLLPDVMQIDRILVHDEKTLFMTPDMKITLCFDVVEGHDEQSDFVAMRKVFASRLMKFFINHPEGCDIPEALLPEPFRQQTYITTPKLSLVDPKTECHSTLMENGLLSEASHLCPSFSRHFSREVVVEAERVMSGSVVESDALNSQITQTSLQEENPCALHLNYDGTANKDINGEEKNEFPSLCANSIGPRACESPVIKPPSRDDSLMVETPAQVTPQRVVSCCENKDKPAKRCLNFLHSEDETLETEGVMLEEKKSMVALVERIFKCVNRPSMTKEELVQKIMMNDCDLTERSEAEERVEKLLVTDCISRKLAPSGDILYTINKQSTR